MAWPINAVRPLPFFVRGRVALAGDAVRDPSSHYCRRSDINTLQAHAMTTHIGAGAGQSIEARICNSTDPLWIIKRYNQDAFILGRILSHPNMGKDNLATALKIYDSVRRPIVKKVTGRSRLSGLLYEFNAPGFEDIIVISEEKYKALGDMINDQWSWQWKTLPDEDWLTTERILQEETSVNFGG